MKESKTEGFFELTLIKFLSGRSFWELNKMGRKVTTQSIEKNCISSLLGQEVFHTQSPNTAVQYTLEILQGTARR